MKNYSKPEIVEVGPAEELVLGGGFMPELDMPIDTQWFRADASIADAD
ncbi:MAG TPA: lasso RiPP family leader peptide-containing protein [Pyrinomonadaceae bacterium]